MAAWGGLTTTGIDFQTGQDTVCSESESRTRTRVGGVGWVVASLPFPSPSKMPQSWVPFLFPLSLSVPPPKRNESGQTAEGKGVKMSPLSAVP